MRQKLYFITSIFAMAVIFCFIKFVSGADISWVQDDWSGGADQSSWSDITKYQSATTVSTSASGISLSTNTNWYNTSWKYRQSVAVTNNSGTTLTNYQIPIYLNTSQLISGSKMKADCGDIRITDSSGSLLPFWIATAPTADTCNQTATKLWVKLTSLPTSGATVYIYYGNSSASSVSNGNNVFAVFGDFTSGTSLPDGWTSTNIGTGGSASVGSGVLTISNINGEDVWVKVYGATHAYKNTAVSGSFVAESLINSQTNSDTWAKAGITVQNSVSAAVSNGQAFVVTTPGNGIAFQYQSLTGQSCVDGICEAGIVAANEQVNGGSYSFPLFLKLSKDANNQVSGYYSSNGSSWTQRGSAVAPLGVADSQYVTLFSTPHNVIGISAATYSFFYVRSYTASEPTVGSPQTEQSPYVASGNLISSIFDTGAASNFGTLSYTYTAATNTTVAVKIRTSNSANMTGADDFVSCNAIVSGTDISSNNCVTDRERYLQYQVVVSSTDYLYTPLFESIDIGYSNTATFTLNYLAGNGGAISGSSTQIVFSGDNGSSVTATPSTGYYFLDWSDGATTTGRTDTNVLSNLSVTANFATSTFTLNYIAGFGGTLTGSSTQVVNYGSNGTTVTATPAVGHSFASWSDEIATAARTDTNITANVSYTATFATNTYTLSYTAGTGGSLSGSTSQTVAYGSNGSAITAVPNAGYHFENWSDNSTANPRTDSNISANLSITANFERTPGGAFIAPSAPKVVFQPVFKNNSINSTVTNVYQMAISENKDFAGSSWEPYNDSYKKMSNKTFYIKFRSRDGGVSEVYKVEKQNNSTVKNTENKIEKPTINSPSFVFTKNLRFGMNNNEVKELQKFLNSHGFTITKQGPGSSGYETTYFGTATREALIKFQKDHNISPAIGNFGPVTRGVVGRM